MGLKNLKSFVKQIHIDIKKSSLKSLTKLKKLVAK